MPMQGMAKRCLGGRCWRCGLHAAGYPTAQCMCKRCCTNLRAKDAFACCRCKYRSRGCPCSVTQLPMILMTAVWPADCSGKDQQGRVRRPVPVVLPAPGPRPPGMLSGAIARSRVPHAGKYGRTLGTFCTASKNFSQIFPVGYFSRFLYGNGSHCNV
jgi:hypothetical protein